MAGKLGKLGTIRIVNIVDYIDLRLLTTTAVNLESIAKKFNLQNGEAAAFVNFKRTRFRLVIKLANIVHIAIPGRDWCLNNDEFIRVAGEYRKIVTTKEAVDRLNSLEMFNKERQLGEVWKEISREREYYMRGLQIEIVELTQRENSLLESILAREAQLEDYPDVQRRIEAIDVQIKSQLDLLKALEMKRGEVKFRKVR